MWLALRPITMFYSWVAGSRIFPACDGSARCRCGLTAFLRWGLLAGTRFPGNPGEAHASADKIRSSEGDLLGTGCFEWFHRSCSASSKSFQSRYSAPAGFSSSYTFADDALEVPCTYKRAPQSGSTGAPPPSSWASTWTCIQKLDVIVLGCRCWFPCSWWGFGAWSAWFSGETCAWGFRLVILNISWEESLQRGSSEGSKCGAMSM